MPHLPNLAPLARRWRQHGRAARALAAAGMLALAALAGASLLALLPHDDALTISGGDLTGNRHFLARALQEAAAGNGVRLALRPTGGSQEALALVAANKLDLAFIQGGLDQPDQNVVQVATVAPELLHFLARPGIDGITALRGRRVNLNTRKGGTRLIAHQILAFAGLRAGIDYIESNIATEQLLGQRGERLPDAIVITSFAPSDVVDYLVNEQGYRLLEVPFAPAFALRHTLATEAEIGAYTYSGAPPVPPRAIKTVGIKLRLVANRHVDAGAIVKLLETLYGPALAARLPMRLDEQAILSAGGSAPSEGTRRFINRDKPLFSRALLEQLKATIGLAVSVFSAVLVVLKWFNAAPPGDPSAGADKHKE
nr:TAXI family TRAP transporter solute-binding subunit [uncultured Duganella sp.]